MQNQRKSVIHIHIPIKNENMSLRNFSRSSTKRINLGKSLIPRHSNIRHKSNLTSLQKQKAKNIETKENEKINKDISKRIIKRKDTYKYNNFNFNKIINKLEVKQEQARERYKKNLFNKRKISKKHFYLIRKVINQRLKNKYKSPYMDYLINKGYFEHFKKSDYPKYYNFYMINYLMQNKRCKLTLRYYDNIYFYNSQEYLIRYFNRNEIFIIMNYVLYFIYNRDIHSTVKIKKKILTDNEILNMFNNLLKSNYNFFGTMEIFEEIGVYYRNVEVNNSNFSKIFCNLNKVKPLFEEKINYLYAKDIPFLQFPNCFPNFFPLEGVMLNYIKKYIEIRKFQKLKDNKSNNNKNMKEKENNMKYVKEKKKRENNDNKMKKNDNSILMELSSSRSKDKQINDEKSESEEKKNFHNSNRRLKIDNDIYDVETLVDKIINGYKGYNMSNKNNTKKIESYLLKKEKKKIYQRRTTRFKTLETSNILNFNKKYFLSPKSLSSNKKLEQIALIKYNPKVSLFKTSLKRLSEFGKGKLKKLIPIISDNKASDKNFIFLKEDLKPKSTNNIKLILFNKKENKEFPSPNTELNILKFTHKNLNINNNEIKKDDNETNNINIKKINNFNTINIINFKEFINKENKFKNKNNFKYKKISSSNKKSRNLKGNNLSERSIFQFNDKTRNTPREASSNSSLKNLYFYKFKEVSKFMPNSTKNRYFVNKYISLKKINSLSKNKSNSQRTIKNYFKGLRQNAFSTYSGINFDEKIVNVWESNKIEGVTVMDAYKTNNLFTKIKNFNIKNRNDFQKSSSFNEIIKCPNIYISNFG